MSLQYYLICIGLGLLISAPVGAIGTMCIRQCLVNGRMMGILSGVACALADAVYAAMTAFGITAVSSYLINHLHFIQLAGSFILLLNGIHLFLDKKAHLSTDNVHIEKRHRIKQLVNIFLITLINPVTIIAIPAIIAASGLLDHHATTAEAWSIVAGIISGTTLWWFFMATMISRYQNRINNRALLFLNHITGTLLCLAAICLTVNAMS